MKQQDRERRKRYKASDRFVHLRLRAERSRARKQSGRPIIETDLCLYRCSDTRSRAVPSAKY